MRFSHVRVGKRKSKRTRMNEFVDEQEHGLGLGLDFKAHVFLYLEGVKYESAGMGGNDSKAY
jgi:hypothetical protein